MTGAEVRYIIDAISVSPDGGETEALNVAARRLEKLGIKTRDIGLSIFTRSVDARMLSYEFCGFRIIL